MKNQTLKFIIAFVLALVLVYLLWKSFNSPEPEVDPAIHLVHDIDSAKKTEKTDEQIIKEIYSGPDLPDEQQDSLIAAYRKHTSQGHK